MAALVLEDGSVLQGRPFGAAVSTAGEVGKQARAGFQPHPTLVPLSPRPVLPGTLTARLLAPFILHDQGSLP